MHEVSAGREPFPGAGSAKAKPGAKKPAVKAVKAAAKEEKPVAAKAKAEEKPAAAAVEKKPEAAEKEEPAAAEKKEPAEKKDEGAAAAPAAAAAAADDGSTPVIEGVALEGLWVSSVGGTISDLFGALLAAFLRTSCSLFCSIFLSFPAELGAGAMLVCKGRKVTFVNSGLEYPLTVSESGSCTDSGQP